MFSKITVLLTTCCLVPFLLLGGIAVDPLIKKRYSGKEFDAGKSISKDQIIALAEAARLSPSSFNEQPWTFIFCEKTLTPDSWNKAFTGLDPSNQKWCDNAPLLVVILSSNQFKKNMKPNFWAQYDTGAAGVSLAYQAVSMGLMTHQVGGIDDDILIEAFDIPNTFTPIAVMAIGYETEEGKANPPQKNRRPLSENFFLGELGKGL